MFFEQNEIKLVINNRVISGKSVNIQKLNNLPLNNTWVNDEITKEIRKYVKLVIQQKLTHHCKAIILQ